MKSDPSAKPTQVEVRLSWMTVRIHVEGAIRAAGLIATQTAFDAAVRALGDNHGALAVAPIVRSPRGAAHRVDATIHMAATENAAERAATAAVNAFRTMGIDPLCTGYAARGRAWVDSVTRSAA